MCSAVSAADAVASCCALLLPLKALAVQLQASRLLAIAALFGVRCKGTKSKERVSSSVAVQLQISRLLAITALFDVRCKGTKPEERVSSSVAV